MQKFSKVNRLCKKTDIEELFKNGDSFKELPFTIISLFKKKTLTPLKVLISIPKKQIPKAADRNKLKRLIREVYRKNNTEIINTLINKEKELHVALLYQEKEIKSVMFLEKKIKLILLCLKKQI